VNTPVPPVNTPPVPEGKKIPETTDGLKIKTQVHGELGIEHDNSRFSVAELVKAFLT
jgi:hypothetical protein